MGYDKPDVYYQPEKFGLTLIDKLDYSSGNYVFDFRVVWKHKSGKFYTARDSGCSCPSPFENYTDLKDLDELSISALEKEIREELSKSHECVSRQEASDFLNKVKDPLK